MKQKKNQKWILILILILIIIALVVLLIYVSITPKNTVNNTLNNLKNGKTKLVNLYVDYEELISVLDAGIIKSEAKEISELEKDCFNSLKWSITGESITDNTATVTVDITTKNFRQILLNWIEKISEKIENNYDISEEENLKLLAESIKEENVQEITTKGNINLERKGLLWQIVIDENLTNSLYPGLNQVLEVMEQLSNELDKENIQK